MMINFANSSIISPKRTRQRLSDWDTFFPYYAGYPASFASSLIDSLALPRHTRIFDPWNGSGTTTYVAALRRFESVGMDINPVMIVVARARSLAPSEADSLLPLALEAVKKARLFEPSILNDPLLGWFDPNTSTNIRSIENALRDLLLGTRTKDTQNRCFDKISGMASTLYVALFLTCRKAGRKFRTSNPTWLKLASSDEHKISMNAEDLERGFLRTVSEMADALGKTPIRQQDSANAHICLGDSVEKNIEDGTIDFVLTSPPYCTRIDYTSATRIELAVLSPLLPVSVEELGRNMLGTTRVPHRAITAKETWGATSLRFIEMVGKHSSRASSGYYTKTHLDYFDKIERSLRSISNTMRDGAGATFVVQDSYYKDVHNDLAQVFVEMGKHHALRLRRRDDFRLSVTLAASHPYASRYERPKGAVETVLCFEKSDAISR